MPAGSLRNTKPKNPGKLLWNSPCISPLKTSVNHVVFPTIYAGRLIYPSATENRKNGRLSDKFLFPFICWPVNVLQAYFSYVLVIHMYEIDCN